MKLFPFDPNANRDEQLKKILNEEMYRREKDLSKASIAPGIEELINHPDYFAHKVTKIDTLAGLALKYKTSTGTIKRINRLPNDLVFQRDLIFIPKSPGCTKPLDFSEDNLSNTGKISVFVTKTGCADEEGKFYLEESNWDLDEALSNWREDMSWSNKR